MSLAGYFTAPEWAALSGGLRLKDIEERDPLRSLMARDLLQEEVCEQLLDALGPVIGSPSRAITASLLGKRLSFLATGACLYAMSVYDKGLLLSLDNAVIEYGHDDGCGRRRCRWLTLCPRPMDPVSAKPGGKPWCRRCLPGC